MTKTNNWQERKASRDAEKLKNKEEIRATSGPSLRDVELSDFKRILGLEGLEVKKKIKNFFHI